jgi:putative endonuclease
MKQDLNKYENSNNKQKYSKKRRFGNKGEDLASMFLMKRGHDILCRNYLRKVGEIDIITEKDGIFHFIEVKSVTRGTSFDFGSDLSDIYRPEDLIHEQKKLHMKHAIEFFMLENNLSGSNIIVDLVVVYFYKSREVPRIDYVENIII